MVNILKADNPNSAKTNPVEKKRVQIVLTVRFEDSPIDV
jgi:hypothetical protein